MSKRFIAIFGSIFIVFIFIGIYLFFMQKPNLQIKEFGTGSGDYEVIAFKIENKSPKDVIIKEISIDNKNINEDTRIIKYTDEIVITEDFNNPDLIEVKNFKLVGRSLFGSEKKPNNYALLIRYKSTKNNLKIKYQYNNKEYYQDLIE